MQSLSDSAGRSCKRGAGYADSRWARLRRAIPTIALAICSVKASGRRFRESVRRSDLPGELREVCARYGDANFTRRAGVLDPLVQDRLPLQVIFLHPRSVGLPYRGGILQWRLQSHRRLCTFLTIYPVVRGSCVTGVKRVDV